MESETLLINLVQAEAILQKRLNNIILGTRSKTRIERIRYTEGQLVAIRGFIKYIKENPKLPMK